MHRAHDTLDDAFPAHMPRVELMKDFLGPDVSTADDKQMKRLRCTTIRIQQRWRRTVHETEEAHQIVGSSDTHATVGLIRFEGP